MPHIAERAKAIIAHRLGVDAAKVTEGASLIADLEADSLSKIELCMAFEQEFGCHIADDLVERIVTVGDAIELITATTARPRKWGYA